MYYPGSLVPRLSNIRDGNVRGKPGYEATIPGTHSNALWAPSTSSAIPATKSSKSPSSSGLEPARLFHNDSILGLQRERGDWLLPDVSITYITM